MPKMVIGSPGCSVAMTSPPKYTLIEMFALGAAAALPRDGPDGGDRDLWEADALHRANNLAQMSSSLGSARVRRLHGLDEDDAAAGALALSRAYAELGRRHVGDGPVACAPLLDIIASQLVRLFSGERPIRLSLQLEAILLPADQRRALILIASELIINALKYAFPRSRGGLVTVMLTRASSRIELAVIDDGVGLLSQAGQGNGRVLIQRLAALLNADMRYSSSAAGLHVIVATPWLPRAVECRADG